ncbi:MAG: sugar transferase [Sphingomonadales bacterium]|nr:sugar transferase [Sphingomonadales bacterium]
MAARQRRAGRPPAPRRRCRRAARCGLARLSFYGLLLFADSIAIIVGFSLAAEVRGDQWLAPGGYSLALLMLPIYTVIAFNRNAFSIDSLRSVIEGVRRALMAMLLAAMLVLLFAFFTQSGLLISRLAFVTAVGVSSLLLIAGRIGIDGLAAGLMRDRLVAELLIVDDGILPPAEAGITIVDARAAGLRPDLTDPAMLDRIAATIGGFDRVIVSAPHDAQAAWSVVLKGAGVNAEILLRDENRLGAIGVGEYGGHDTVMVSRGPLSLINRAKKRGFDIAVAGLALIALGPLMLIVALLIRLESPGPALFRQLRVGRSNRHFQILKFRSMRVNQAGADGAISTQRDDDRITRVGRFIRATSIDELPQLINVLRGDMSIVGPRPHALGSLAGDKLFWEVSERYWMRHALRPGITGLAQIRGFRGATHRREDLVQRLQADLEYLNGWRLSRDLAILIGTVRVLVHKNAY